MELATEQTGAARLSEEVARRRTFAIISHPDAGKTTLTEKLLLYGGAVETAGAVRAGRNQRHATSDWMDLEQERGISITASALEIEYQGFRLNLLDTPGHQDFSEDTYRTLMVADSAVMVLDSAKGIEAQTEKLFQVCRMRGIPILTFINKLDHFGRDPLELMDEIERVLGIATAPMNWPIGMGSTFQGVYDLQHRRVDLLLPPVRRQQRGALRREVEQPAHRLGRPLGQHGLQRTGRGEDDDQQPAVHDLPDRRRTDRRDDHQQVDVERALTQRPESGEGGLPATRDVAGQQQRPPSPRR